MHFNQLNFFNTENKNEINFIKEENSIDIKVNSKLKSSSRLSKYSSDTRDAQRCFNKFVKYHVKKRFGENILVDHQVRDLDFGEMLEIRSIILNYLLNNSI